MRETRVRNYKVKYEENAKEGIKYLLYDLDSEEARVFFDQARAHKYAKFEDDSERQYTLSYNSDGTYTLTRRSY